MDPDGFGFDFVNTAEIQAQKREALRQMKDINDRIESVKKKLKRLEEVKKHLKISYGIRFRKIDWGGQYAGRWLRSEVDFNSRLTGNVRQKADRIGAAVNHYVEGPLDPVLEGVHGEGLKGEIRGLIDSRKQVLDRHPILDFATLLSGWSPQSQYARSVRDGLKKKEARSKERLFTMLLFLVLFVMETEGHAGAYCRFVSQLEVEEAENPRMPLISKFSSLLKDARWRCSEMTNLRRMTRNILECYSSMTFLEGEVRELMDILVDRMQHLDMVLQDIPQRRAGDSIFLQPDWGREMMTRFEETVISAVGQMWLVYGPCFQEWAMVMATWTGAALAT